VAVTIYAKTRVQLRTGRIQRLAISPLSRILLGTALILTLAQIIFGAQVRQQIDVLNAASATRETWTGALGPVYLYHRIMAIVVLILNLAIFGMLRRSRPLRSERWLAIAMPAIVLTEYAAGLTLHNFDFPASIQPVHLVLAMILFGVQFGLLVRTKKGNRSQESGY
ncbi:MAG TPA: COX15/CtaA family protein, partial [Bacteroidia bacterium]|nr:COX15/CtaA family protein [Bacteroidia bacterium]